MGVIIEKTKPDAPDVAALIARHFALMRSQSPPESCHVLPGDALAGEDMHLFVLREEGLALCIGAVHQTGESGEVKSMHTLQEARGKGFARAMLLILMDHARSLGIKRLNLETGSGKEHAAARALYASEGFVECSPFGNYSEDPLSLFMTRAI